MQLEELKKLAVMARLDMPEEEMLEIAQSFDSILAYVGQIQEVAGTVAVDPQHMVTNITRDDVVTNTPGQYTEAIIAQMPDSQDGFLKVKQIL